MGRRVAAFFIDVFAPLVGAILAGALLWVSSATQVDNAGSNFCERFRARSATVSDEVYDRFDPGATCFASGDTVLLASSDDTGTAVFVGLAVSMLIPLNLFVLQGVTGAAAGKHMLGLRVVRADGTVAGFGKNALRTLLLLVATVISGFCFGIGWIAEMIVAGVTKRHQRVGDMAAGTFVVRKESVGRPVVESVAAVGPTQTSWQQSAPGPNTWGAPVPTWGSPTTTPQPQQSAPSQTSEAQIAPNEPPVWGQSVAPDLGTTSPSVAEPQPEAAGWAAPSPAAAPVTQPGPAQQAPAMNLPPGAEMRWDERWNAWLYWDPTAQRWLRHDPATNQWLPM
jgi:uncharacterized RDD family membrane protein YckC